MIDGLIVMQKLHSTRLPVWAHFLAKCRKKQLNQGELPGRSKQMLNGTSAQLGYTVPFTFTSVHTEKYLPEDKSKEDTTKTKHKPEKNTKHSKTKLAWFSCFSWHSARKQGGLILQRSLAHMGWLNQGSFVLLGFAMFVTRATLC